MGECMIHDDKLSPLSFLAEMYTAEITYKNAPILPFRKSTIEALNKDSHGCYGIVQRTVGYGLGIQLQERIEDLYVGRGNFHQRFGTYLNFSSHNDGLNKYLRSQNIDSLGIKLLTVSNEISIEIHLIETLNPKFNVIYNNEGEITTAISSFSNLNSK
jgi:hypothetical protein